MINSLVGRLQSSSFRLILSPLVTTATFVFFLCFFFEPKWETNDDVAMSMISHGYGIATIGLPNLIFSNVLWGCLVRVIPEINGVLGYSIATLSVLVIVGTVVVYGLRQLGTDRMTCLSILALILVRPVLFPQFTVNAGLLMVGAIICWHLYAQQNDRRALLIGCLLAFCSYLVRSQESLLVFIVALPLLSWRVLFSHRFAKIAFLALIVTIAVSAVIDYQAYQSDDWNAFRNLKPALSPIIDFGAGANLKQHPDILQRHGYSNNDIDLIMNWFFVDPNIANPKALLSMLDELGYLPAQDNALANAWLGVQAVWHENLLPLVLAALLLTALRPSWQVVMSWGLFIAAVFTLGLLGRPSVLRVYVPLASLLLVAPFLRVQASTWHSRLDRVVWALLVAAVLNASHVFSESKAFQVAAVQIRQNLVDFPKDTVIAWGASFPFEAVYPVLGASSAAMSYKLYILGWPTLAPFSHHFAGQKTGGSMIDLLTSDAGVMIIADMQSYASLQFYCEEHLHGQIKEISLKPYGSFVMSQRRCEVKP